MDRPNLLIKIPGTDEGVPAIEQAIYEGINVNVTLLFAVEAYEKVAEAYIRGLERRLEEGKPLDVHSVASFFVSRVDTEVDKRLGDGHPELHGIAAIANARAAYQRFKAIFAGERWDRLAAAGAVVQRPLWASTSVKNPAYPETMYVDDLVAPDTVNTMPMATLLAAAEKAEITGPTADQDPTEDLQKLADAGIDMADVTRVLLDAGIEQFVVAMNQLIDGVEQQREAVVLGAPPTIEAHIPADVEAAVAQRVKAAQAEGVAQRIWRKDPRLWGGPDKPEIENRLGWLTITEPMLEHLDELLAFVEEVKAAGYTDAVLLGMGGSSLGPEVLRRSFGAIDGALRLQVLDSTDPAEVLAVERSIDLDKTLFVVSSKSGATIETLSHYRLFLVAAARRRPLRRRHRPRLAAGRPGSPQRVPPRVRERPEHRRALQRAVVLRPRARGAHGHRRRRAAAPRPGGRGGVCGVRLQRVQRGPVAGAGDGRARAPGPRQGDVRRL